MKPTYLMLVTLLIISLFTGCARNTDHIDSVTPLDRAVWPTAQPPVPTVTPTIFQELSLDDFVESVTPTPTPTQTPVRIVATMASLSELTSTTPEPAAIAEVAPVSFSTADVGPQPLGLLPVTAAQIGQSEVLVRPGPDQSYAAIDKLTDPAEELPLLGLDQSGRWGLVQPARLHAKTGWVNLAQLTTEADLSNASRLTTAWVKSNAVPVRRGPGLFYEQVGSLSINSLLIVHGTNEGRNWLLVQPIGSNNLVWARPQNLTLHLPLAELPIVSAPALEPARPAAVVAAPAAPSQPGLLVIQTSSGGEFMVINEDGSDLRSLTHGLDPALSPDGTQVAFTRWDQGEAGNGTVRIMNVNGTWERVVHEFVKQPKGVAWSPDGSKLVINHQSGGRLTETRACRDADRTPPIEAFDIKLGLNDKLEPRLCWSLPPDPHWQLRVITLADSSIQDIDGGLYAFRPTWDVTEPWRVVADSGRGLVAVDATGQSQGQPLTDNFNDGSPVFAKDGQYLALSASSQRGGGGHDIYRLNRDGSGRVKLTQTPLWVSVQPDAAPQWNHVAPEWSPHGHEIAYLTDRAGRWEIWRMHADGSNQRPMFSEAVNDKLNIQYNFVDERVLSWR